jgi:hypothetical protein
LTGDYNGLHQWDAYARRFGFGAAFAHPQRIAAQCLARMAPLAELAPQRLDLWIKGPVFYGCEAVLRESTHAAGDGSDFALWVEANARPALIGSWQSTAAA